MNSAVHILILHTFVRMAGHNSSGLGFVRFSSALPLILPPPLRPPPLHYPTPASARHHIVSERAAIQDTEETMGMRWGIYKAPTTNNDWRSSFCSICALGFKNTNIWTTHFNFCLIERQDVEFCHFVSPCRRHRCHPCTRSFSWEETQKLPTWTPNSPFDWKHTSGPCPVYALQVYRLKKVIVDASARCPSTIRKVGSRIRAGIQSDPRNQDFGCALER